MIPRVTEAPLTPALRARLLVRRVLALRGMPLRAALFHLRVYGRALRRGDWFSLRSGTPPRDVAELLRVARGARNVVELGTATAWTTGALVVDDAERRVLSFDPIVRPERDAYLALLSPAARARITLVEAPGAAGAAQATDLADLLFIDSSHEHAATVEEFSAWRDRLAAGAVVVFHDYTNPTFPGVARAVADLGLSGEVRSGMFVWRVPG